MQLHRNADLWLLLLLLLLLRAACVGPRPPHVVRRHGPRRPARRLCLPVQRIGACREGLGRGRMRGPGGREALRATVGHAAAAPAMLPVKTSKRWCAGLGPAVPAELTWHDGLQVLLPAQRVRHVSRLHPAQLVVNVLRQLCRRRGQAGRERGCSAADSCFISGIETWG